MRSETVHKTWLLAFVGLALVGAELPEADLGVTKLDATDPVGVASALTYAISVTNHGPDAAPNVVITDTLPPGTVLVSALGCVPSATGFTCNAGTIEPGGFVLFSARVLSPERDGVITNHASVSGGIFDPNPENDTATESTTVVGNAAESTIVVRQVETPDDPTRFPFHGNFGPFVLDSGESAVFPVSAGRYYVQEEIPPSGWRVDGILCESLGPSVTQTMLGEGMVVIDVVAGDTVTCTFSNVLDPDAGFGCRDR